MTSGRISHQEPQASALEVTGPSLGSSSAADAEVVSCSNKVLKVPFTL